MYVEIWSLHILPLYDVSVDFRRSYCSFIALTIWLTAADKVDKVQFSSLTSILENQYDEFVEKKLFH